MTNELSRKDIKQIVSQIPYWIRFTEHCPFKLYGMRQPAQMFNIEPSKKPAQYYGFLRGFFDADENFAQCVKDAARWAVREQHERSEFKKLIAQAPIDVLYEYGIERAKTAYQNPASRNEFRRLLARYMKGKEILPTPTGFNDHPRPYHANRQIIRKPSGYIPTRNARLASIQIRPNSYVQNFH